MNFLLLLDLLRRNGKSVTLLPLLGYGLTPQNCLLLLLNKLMDSCQWKTYVFSDQENDAAASRLEEEGPGFSKKEDAIDDATLVHSNHHEVHYYDFHIVYSASYRVPVLYFRGYDSGWFSSLSLWVLSSTFSNKDCLCS
uniref:Ubiquitin-like-conjugating enzyme ATG10 n=1 Tax=Manihot esculenta TaxID=3983 RepID=A0A2C9UR38_MANES